MNTLRIICILFLSLVLFAPSVMGMRLYSLEVGQYLSEEKAQLKEKELSAQMAPVLIQRAEQEDAWRIQVGHFFSEVEAWVYQSYLKETDFPDCRIVSWNWDGRALESPLRVPVEWPFEPAGLTSLPRDTECLLDHENRPEPPQEAEAALNARSPEELKENDLYLRGYWTRKNREGIAALEKLLEEYPESSLAPQALLRLSRRYMGTREIEKAQACLEEVVRRGNEAEKAKVQLFRAYTDLYSASRTREEVFEAFRQVVNNEEANPEDRLDAMIRCAAVAYSKRWYPKAWLAYTQIEQAVDTPKIVAFARMHKAALALELYGYRVGNLEDTPRLYRAVLDMEDVPVEVRATADLMYLETLFQKRHYQASLEAAQQFIKTYPEVKRDTALAKIWVGIIQETMGDRKAALETFETTFEETDFEYPQHSFKGLNIKSIAAYRAMLLSEEGSRRKENWLEILRTRYPDSQEWRNYIAQ